MSKPHGSFLPRAPVAEDKAWHFYDEGFQAEFPALFELLAATTQDGKPRESASVTIYVDQGRLKAIVSDKSSKMTYFTTLSGSCHALAELDRNIQDGKGDWRKQKEGWVKR